MNEFKTLRERLRERRDKAIAAAIKDYQDGLQTLEALEQSLTGRNLKRKKVTECVDAVMPHDRTFTHADIMKALEASDPGRVWLPRAAQTHIDRMIARGLVKRVRRATSNAPAIFAVRDLDVEISPMANVTILDAIRSVLVRPMTKDEVAIAVIEFGFETTMTPQKLRNYVGDTLRTGPFKQTSGKWVAQ